MPLVPRSPALRAAAFLAVLATSAPSPVRGDIPAPPRNEECSVERLERSGDECVVAGLASETQRWAQRGFERRCDLYRSFRGGAEPSWPGGVWCRAPLATSKGGAPGVELPAAPPPAATAVPAGRDAAAVAAGTATVALQVGQALEAQRSPGHTLAVSPLGLWTALAALSAGARGETAAELRAGLGLTGPAADAAAGARALAEDLRRRGVALTLASAVLVDDARAVSPEFAAVARAAGAALAPADLRRSPGDTRARLDRWSARETGGRVPRVVPPRTLFRNTRVAVASAVDLVVQLPATFGPGAPASFYLGARLAGPRARFGFRPGDRVPVALKTVPTRRAAGTFPVASLDGVLGPGADGAAIVVDVPLGGGLAMTLVVPHAMYAPAPALGRPLPALLESLRPQRVELTIPDFTVDGAPLALADALARLGSEHGPFDPRAGDLSGIAASAADGERLAGAELFHAVRLELGGGSATSPPPVGAGAPAAATPAIQADHPFLFLVRDVASGAILVSGAVNDPAPAQEETVADAVPRMLLPAARALGDGTVVPGASVVRGGLRPEQLRETLERHADDVASCYGQQLVLEPRLGGTLTLRWVFDARGEPREVQGAGPAPGLPSERLRACVARRLAEWSFAARSAGTVEQSWTLRPPTGPSRGASIPGPGHYGRRYARQPGERCREAGAQDGLGRRGGADAERPTPRSADLQILGSLDRARVRKVLAAHDAEIRAAYRQRLAQQRGLQGTVAIEWNVDHEGTARDPRVDCSATTLDDAFVFEAMKARIAGWRFPRPVGGGTAVVNHRWTFVPVAAER